ncbi:Protein CBG20433 [Caenorhabditis briggsae]|uniref:Protein CBG20402 n=1 Tax=Caenorhabditis briggsae TaxID=6238 RepID=G2J712_CAEBR|nr:Protein CBG20402 [Caenorhabditis briggsae]XP_002646575.1 Protein CBG20433 [Caenorhabditis briggsae]CAP37416.1 Protein CBG20402 [Caenorhabditis briggsae]CAP37446.1 Protein CBG20433 [Caenorhabditis briggsae]
MVMSFLILFENRSTLIVNNIFRFQNNSTRNLWLFLNIFGCMALMVPIFLNFPNPDDARMVLLKNSHFSEILRFQIYWKKVDKQNFEYQNSEKHSPVPQNTFSPKISWFTLWKASGNSTQVQ